MSKYCRVSERRGAADSATGERFMSISLPNEIISRVKRTWDFLRPAAPPRTNRSAMRIL